MALDKSDPRLKRAITTDSDISRASLATRILVSRLRADVKRDPNSMANRVLELHNFLSTNEFAQRDLAFL